jgi:NAD(P)-dependent dehydrogenase (short-subunit alcohol dehydrogenase family)
MILTDMGDSEFAFKAHVEGITAEEAAAQIAERSALRRNATPEEVADVVAYLAGPASSYLTGIALPVAGGSPAGL